MTIAVPLPQANVESRASVRIVAFWLLSCCAMVFLMAIIGAVTRLTESGLSIVEWKPLIGIVPPLTETDWLTVFGQYRQTPEYKLLNAGMSLEEFKHIFFWEWLHRAWGRLIGLVFAVPFVWFMISRRLPAGLTPKLLGILLLGGLQGFVGWFMVQSGLIDRPSVSHYRLAMHLGLALLIYALMLWLALDLIRPGMPGIRDSRVPRLQRLGWTLLALVSCTMLWGAFVAGLDAGMIYNTFPLMGGQVLPPDLWRLTPGWLNLFENHGTVQFIHRMLGVSTAVVAFLFWLSSRDMHLTGRLRRLCAAVAWVAAGQMALGVFTLVSVVPVALGAAHQAGAITLLTVLLWTQADLRAGLRSQP